MVEFESLMTMEAKVHMPHATCTLTIKKKFPTLRSKDRVVSPKVFHDAIAR
jgi:hypothetical protein